MSQSFTPEDKARIAEEPHVHNEENVRLAKEVVKEGGKADLKIILIILGIGVAIVGIVGAIFLLPIACYLVAMLIPPHS